MDGEKPQRSRFLSLKWKLLSALSLVLILVNGSLAILVYQKTLSQHHERQAQQRTTQIREWHVVLSRGFESISAFASFIPRLSIATAGIAVRSEAASIAAALAEHGAMLDLEWGVNGAHYYAAGRLDRPLASWPADRVAPDVRGLLEITQQDELPHGRVLCGRGCTQLLVQPLLRDGETSGYLVVERSIADSLREFHLLSGAEMAVLSTDGLGPAQMERAVADWSAEVAAVSHPDDVMPVLRALSRSMALTDLLTRPGQIEIDAEWYEVFALPRSTRYPDLVLLALNRVTGQVNAVRDATADSMLLGLSGLLLSEIILLLVIWKPVHRIQDVVYALPLFAERLYAQLRQELPKPSLGRLPRDETDVMIETIAQVSGQMEALDEAYAHNADLLIESERKLRFAQKLARVASWEGEPIAGLFRMTQGADRIDLTLAKLESWSDFMALVHFEDRKHLTIAWRRARGGSVMDVEFRLVIDGQTIYIHCVAEFETVGRIRTLRGVGMLQDISRLRRAERELRRQRDHLEEEVAARTVELVEAHNSAQRLARSKGEFLANMSHEIRTPLNAVLGLSQIGMQQSRNRMIGRTFEQILDAGDHLLNVVNDVLDDAKLEAGKLAIESQPFELRRVADLCIDMLMPRAGAKGLSLAATIGGDLSEWVIGDAFRLRQVLLNLLSNAVKFTDEGGVSLDVTGQADGCCFTVTDTGPGMSESALRQLFKPFEQVSAGTPKRLEGTGLGLSISHRLARMMGGSIRVKSAQGKGSEFALWLPLAAGSGDAPMRQLSAPISDGQGARLAGRRILVADDVAINRSIVEALLQSEGAEAICVADGVDVLNVTMSEGEAPFDAVLMDVEMPTLGGREATHRLRAAGFDLPVIGLTAHVAPEERARSLAAGMDDQLVKPIMQETLVRCLLPFFDGERATG